MHGGGGCHKRVFFFSGGKTNLSFYTTWGDAHIKLCSLQKQIALLLSGLFTELIRGEIKSY